MTNKEIDKLLSMLDKKSLSEVKKYLIKEKTNNDKKILQKIFENYMFNKDKAFKKFDNNYGTILYTEHKDILVFSNGISVYYANKERFNIESDVIKKYSLQTNIKSQHTIKIINKSELSKYENILKTLKTELKPINLFPDYIDKKLTRFSVFNPYHDLKEDIEDYISFDFSTKEIENAEILLDNPEFYMDITNPLIYGESDKGKVFILGIKNK